jgi:hypothetical protein
MYLGSMIQTVTCSLYYVTPALEWEWSGTELHIFFWRPEQYSPVLSFHIDRIKSNLKFCANVFLSFLSQQLYFIFEDLNKNFSCGLLGCCTVLSSGRIPTFWRNKLLPYSWLSVPPQQWKTIRRLHGTTTQKTSVLTHTTMKTSNTTHIKIAWII